jgi:hypothetical protein
MGGTRIQAFLEAEGILPHPLVRFTRPAGGDLVLGFTDTEWGRGALRHDGQEWVAADWLGYTIGHAEDPAWAFSLLLAHLREGMSDDDSLTHEEFAAELLLRGHHADVKGGRVRVVAGVRVLEARRTRGRGQWAVVDAMTGESLLPGRAGTLWFAAAALVGEVARGRPGLAAMPVPTLEEVRRDTRGSYASPWDASTMRLRYTGRSTHGGHPNCA